MGTAAGSALALALLVCGCVFAALAGPALSLHTRTQALHQTLAGYPNTTKTVQVTASWETFAGSLQPIRPGQNLDNVLPQALNDVGSGLRGDAAPARGRRLGQPDREADPRRGRRGGQGPGRGATPAAGLLPHLVHRLRAAGARARSAAAAFRPVRWAWPPPRRRPHGSGCTGSRLTLAAPSGPVTLFVTAIVRPRQAGSTFWRQDATPVQPALEQVNPNIAALLGRRGHRGPGPVRRVPERVRRHRSRAAAGVPAQRRRHERGPGARAVQRAEPRHRGHAHADRRARARRGRADRQLAAPAGPGPVPRHPGGRRDRAPAPVRQPGRGRRGGDPARGPDARRAPPGRAGHPAGPGRIARAGGGAGAARRGGRGRAGRADRRGPGRRRRPRRRRPRRRRLAGWPLAGIAILAALAGPPVIAVWRHTRRPAPPANPALITTAETRPTGPAWRWRRPVAEVTAIAASVAGLVRPARPGRAGRRMGSESTCTSPSCRSWSPSRSSWSCCGSIR